MADAPLAILAAGGRLPEIIAEQAQQQGRAVFLVLLQGFASPQLERFPHIWSGIGRFGRIFSGFKSAGCRDLVMAGSLVRPNILHTIPDWKAIKTIPELFRLYRGGDDHLLRGIAALFEREGFHLRGVHEVVPQLLTPLGALTKTRPTPADETDMARGLAAISALGPFDVGQGLIIADNRIVAVEGAEGTDGLLARQAEMRANGRIRWSGARGLLVKAPKPDQDHRIDLPAIGINTVDDAVKAGLRGIAVQAGSTLVLDAQQMIQRADSAGLFIVGFAP